jgi:hypothetical protein
MQAERGLVRASTNSHVVAGYPVESREVPPVAVYLGRLSPNTRTSARYRLERLAEALSDGRESAFRPLVADDARGRTTRSGAPPWPVPGHHNI